MYDRVQPSIRSNNFFMKAYDFHSISNDAVDDYQSMRLSRDGSTRRKPRQPRASAARQQQQQRPF